VIGDYYPLDEQPQMRPEELTVAEEEAMEAVAGMVWSLAVVVDSAKKVPGERRWKVIERTEVEYRQQQPVW